MSEPKTEKTKSAKTLPGVIRPATIQDARAMQALIGHWADEKRMLPRALSELFETIRQYNVYEENGALLGVCGLHISWEDLAEVRALAVAQEQTGRGIGAALVQKSIEEAIRLAIPRVFTLTYEPEFFARLGFAEMDKSQFPHKVWTECVRCHKFPDCDETGMIINIT